MSIKPWQPLQYELHSRIVLIKRKFKKKQKTTSGSLTLAKDVEADYKTNSWFMSVGAVPLSSQGLGPVQETK